jgi:hypothetical protein
MLYKSTYRSELQHEPKCARGHDSRSIIIGIPRRTSPSMSCSIITAAIFSRKTLSRYFAPSAADPSSGMPPQVVRQQTAVPSNGVPPITDVPFCRVSMAAYHFALNNEDGGREWCLGVEIVLVLSRLLSHQCPKLRRRKESVRIRKTEKTFGAGLAQHPTPLLGLKLSSNRLGVNVLLILIRGSFPQGKAAGA